VGAVGVEAVGVAVGVEAVGVEAVGVEAVGVEAVGGRYRLIEMIGSGGMCEVRRAGRGPGRRALPGDGADRRA
jgi:hypothetical protein